MRLKITSRLVVLDVVVTDSKGAIVPSLKKEDFQLFQDNQPQPIRNFEAPEVSEAAVAGAAAAAGGSLAPTAAGRLEAPLTIYVLDELNTPFDEKSYSAFTLKTYLERQPASLLAPAMLLLINDRGLHTLSLETQNRDALLSALEKRPASYPNQLANSNKLELLSESFAILRQISLSLEGSRAHKTLVWLGRGFPTVDSTELDAKGNEALQAAIKQTVAMLTRDRITLYKVDPITTNARAAPTDLATSIDQGSGMGSSSAVDPIAENPLANDFNFNQFAVQTGGQYFYGSNDLEKQIATSLQRGAQFYTLTYTPHGELDPSKYHKVRIQMRDPNLTAVTRQGFYDESGAQAEPSTKNIGFDLSLAAASTMAYDGVDVKVLGAKAVASTNRVTVNFTVQDRSLSWEPQAAGNESARILVVLAALDGDHKVQTSATASLGLAAKDSMQIARGLVTTASEVSVNEKTRYVRLLVRDSSGRIGSAELEAGSWK